MNKINVLQVLPNLDTGGGQKIAIDIANLLNPEIFKIEIVSLYPAANQLFEFYTNKFNLPINYLKKQKGVNLSVVFDLNKIIKRIKPQVIHSHLRTLPYLLFSTSINHVPVHIHTVHNVAEKESTGIHQVIQRFAFQKNIVIPVSISKEVQSSVFNVYGNVNSPIIYNGINSENFSFSKNYREIIRRKYKISDDSFVFINIARFSPEKNHKEIIDVFKNVNQEYPFTKLLLIGDGLLFTDMKIYSMQLNLSDKVIFIGNTLNVSQFLSASDCFLLFSLWEGLPISILEAMASGLPIISTSVGGIPELVINGEHGYLIRSGRYEEILLAMKDIIKNPEKAKIMGKKGIELVNNKFTSRSMTNAYSELYFSLIKEHKKKYIG